MVVDLVLKFVDKAAVRQEDQRRGEVHGAIAPLVRAEEETHPVFGEKFHRH